MKVNNNVIFFGDKVLKARHEEEKPKNRRGEEQKKSNVVSLAQDPTWMDPINNRLKMAKNKAMKILSDAYLGDRTIESDLKSRNENISELTKIKAESSEALKELKMQQEELQKKYNVEDGSKEQHELDLLLKEVESEAEGSGITLTEEEKQELEAIKDRGLTEYQTRSLGLKAKEAPLKEKIKQADMEIRLHNAVASKTKVERTKSDFLTKARRKAEGVMDSAYDDVKGLLMDEAREHVEEENRKERVKAEKAEEKKKDEEEKIEKAKSRREEIEERTEHDEEFAESVLQASNDVTVGSVSIDEAQKEIKRIMGKMQLIEDDIKGAVIDTNL